MSVQSVRVSLLVVVLFVIANMPVKAVGQPTGQPTSAPTVYLIPAGYSTYNSSYYFDGVDDYGYIPSIVLPSTKTIEAWVTTPESGDVKLATMNNPSSGSGPFNELYFSFQVGDGDAVMDVGSPGASNVLNVGNTIPANENVHLVWQNVNGGYQAADWAYYINGIYAGSNTRGGSYTPSLTGTGLHIATIYSYGNTYFDFSLHQMRISDHVRYTTSFTPSYPLQSDANTLGLWDLTSNQGDTVADISSNGNTLSLYGATYVASLSPCVPGKYAPEGSGECINCPQGTISTIGAASACVACGAGYTTSSTGATSCISQPTGQPTGEPTGHPSGRPTGQPSGQPTSQPTHSICSEVARCTYGHYCGSDQLCMPCPAGFWSLSGQNSCQPCAAGSYSLEGSSNCTHCSPGYYSGPSSSYCDTCSSGSYSTKGQSLCQLCLAGTYSLAGASNCTACTNGEFSGPGASSCDSCSN